MIGFLNLLSFFQLPLLRKAVGLPPEVAESQSTFILPDTTEVHRDPNTMAISGVKFKVKSTGEASSGAFHLFPKLPANIRVKIWRAANSHPRIIMCEHYHDGFPKSVRPPHHPSTFAVSVESRSEAKEAYKMIFEPRLGHAVAFNYKTDTLFLANYDVTWYFRGSAYQKYEVDHRAPIRSLALNTIKEPIWMSRRSGEFIFDSVDVEDIFHFINWFPNIRDLFIIPDIEVQAAKGVDIEDLEDIKTAEEMNLAGECLEKLLHGILRKMRRKCCILHKADCECTFWRLPQIHFMSIPDMQKYLGAEVLNINDPHFGEKQVGKRFEVRPVS